MWSGRRATKSRLRWRFRYQTSSEGVHGFGGFMPVRARTAGGGAGGSGPSCAGRHSHQPMTRRAGIHTPIRASMQPSRAKLRSGAHNSAAPRERPAGQAAPEPPTRVRGAPGNRSRIALRGFSVHAVHDHRPHGVAAGRGVMAGQWVLVSGAASRISSASRIRLRAWSDDATSDMSSFGTVWL